jgi:hypothetical protein
MRLHVTASKVLSALLGLIACSSPAEASTSRGPDEAAASIIEWISNFQQDIQDSRAETPQAIPQADASGPSISLDQLSDAATIEQTLRRLLDGKGPLRLTVPNGRAWLGDFGLGTGDTLRGNLLVLRGTAEIFGRLEGNVVALDGDIVVHRGASVSGDALALSGRVRDADRAIEGEIRSLSSAEESVTGSSGSMTVFRRGAGLLGVFLILAAIGVGLVTFARPTLETVSDTVRHSLGRAFVTGLVAQMLVLPTFGMLIVGLALTVVGVLLIPFAIAAYVLLFLAAVVLGILAMSHAMGETYTRRRMALGVLVSPNSYRYVGLGLTALLGLWAVWALFGWVPVAGTLVLGGASVVTWVLGTVGFGASLLSRAGIRPDFAGRLVPPEALTDEYLWATPQMGVPAVKRPTPPPAPPQ